MSHEAFGASERASALRARVRFHSGVNTRVSRKMMFSFETLPAVTTRVRFAFRTRSRVLRGIIYMLRENKRMKIKFLLRFIQFCVVLVQLQQV